MTEEKIPEKIHSGTIVDYAFSHFKKMSPPLQLAAQSRWIA